MSDEPVAFDDPPRPPNVLTKPASTGDIVSAVLAGIVAFAVSLLPTGNITWNMITYGGADSPAVMGLLSLWNLMVLGPSIYGVGSWWLWSTRQTGLIDRTFLWRVYWKVQWVTILLLPALSILFCGICSTVMSIPH